MVRRCTLPNNPYYHNYGGRGIKVLWSSFEEFYKDMSSTYHPELSLDRIDTNGHYCKENCRWADRRTQNVNKRNNHFLQYDGEVLTLTEMAEKYNINKHALTGRLKNGWTIDDAINKKPRSRGCGKPGIKLSPQEFSGTVKKY